MCWRAGAPLEGASAGGGLAAEDLEGHGVKRQRGTRVSSCREAQADAVAFGHQANSGFGDDVGGDHVGLSRSSGGGPVGRRRPAWRRAAGSSTRGGRQRLGARCAAEGAGVMATRSLALRLAPSSTPGRRSRCPTPERPPLVWFRVERPGVATHGIHEVRDQLFAIDCTGSHPLENGEPSVVLEYQHDPVHLEKGDERVECCALVAIEEGMVLGDAVRERGRQLREGVVVAGARRHDGGFQEARVPDAGQAPADRKAFGVAALHVANQEEDVAQLQETATAYGLPTCRGP